MVDSSSIKIGIIGAGAFGTALGDVLCTSTRSVLLYSLDAQFPQELKSQRTNKNFLPGHTLNAFLQATTNPEDLSDSDLIILAVPSRFMREALKPFLPYFPYKNPPLISVTKGLDPQTGHFMSQLIEEVCPDSPVAVLTGPSYVSELIRKEPTLLALACVHRPTLEFLKTHLSAPSLILRPTTDIMGVQIGGVLKNVIAIAAGFVRGKGLGENARAIIMVKGLEEMKHLGRRLGVDPETFIGPSGLGDLILTAMSDVSRNTAFGKSLAEGEVTAETLSSSKTVEGVSTALSLAHLTKKLDIRLSLCDTVVDLLSNKCSHEKALERLLFDKPDAS